MKKFLLLAPILWAATLSLGHATTVGFSLGPTSRSVFDSSGTLNQTNSLVLEGTFANESFTLNSALNFQQNVTSIMASGGWEQFGLDTVTNTTNASVSSTLMIQTLSGTGRVSGSVTDNNTGASKADFFNGKGTYLWIFNAPTIGAATEMGIFRASAAAVPWTFPTNASGLGDGVNLSTASTTTINAIGGVGSASSTQLTLAGVVPVPEPSTFAFGILGAVAALCSRQRSRKV